MVVVKNPQGEVIAEGVNAERVDAQGEQGLIKVTVNAEGGFFYLGNTDRDTFVIETV